MPSLSVRTLCTALLALALAAGAAAPARAARVTAQEDAAALGWLRVQHAGWDFPVFLPDYGELLRAGVDGQRSKDLGGNDFIWVDPGFDPGYGFAAQIDGQYSPLPAGSPGENGWVWLDAFVTQNLEQAGATITASDLHLEVNGRRWLRYDFDQQPAGTEQLHSIACVTPCNQGIATVRFYIADIDLSVSYDVMVDEVLGGPLSEMNGGDDAPELEPSLPSAEEAPAAPAVDEVSAEALLWAFGGQPAAPAAPAGALPQSDRPRLAVIPDWAGVLYLPGSGTLRIAGENGVTTADLGGVALEWTDDAAPAGQVGKIIAAVAADAGNPLAGDWAARSGRVRSTLAAGGARILAERTDAQYGGEPWLVYEVQEPDDPAGRPGAHFFAVYGESGLNGLLLYLYCQGPADEAALEALLGSLLAGTAGLAQYIGQ
jgi:hypothetical protein